MSDSLQVTLNGEGREFDSALTVVEMLRRLGLDSGRVAIERNREILPRSQWAATQVAAGDRYEIVQFVGGG